MSDLIAVTGATGGLGSLVIDQLTTRVATERIVAIARDAAAARTLPDSVQVRIADHEDRATVDAAVAGVGVLLLISGNEFGKRLQQHRNVIDAARQSGVGRLAYTSAPHADTSDAFITSEHKATEQMIGESGLDHNLIRLNSWYDLYRPHITAGAKTGKIIGSVHDGRVAAASKAEYAEAIAGILATDEATSTVYELSGDTSWDYHELAAAISDVVGRSVTYEDLTSEQHAAALHAQGVDDETCSFLVRLDADVAGGVSADATDQLRQLIGRPTTSLVDGLRAVVDGDRR